MNFDSASAVPEQQFDPTSAVPEEAPPVRAVLQTAVKQNPDQVARATALGKQYGVPTDVVVRNLQDVEFQAAVDAADERLKTSPKLAAAMRKRPEIAPLVHDDLKPLTDVEAAVAKYGEWKAWNGPAPTTKNIVLGLAKAVPQAGAAIKAGLDAQMADFLEWAGLITLDPIVKADRARKLAQASGAADFTRPEFESTTGQAVYGGVESTLRMIPGLFASLATRSPTPILAAAGVQTQGEAYAKYKTRGATGTEAFIGATGEGAVEVLTELLPAQFLTEKLGKAGVREFFTGYLKKDVLGEQAATILQDAIDTAVANPDKTWGDYLNERPEAAYTTLVATLTQSGLMTGVNSAVRRLAQQGDDGQAAKDASDSLADALKTAGSAALRERSPEQFRELMGEMTDGKVYVDGEVLNQLPPDVIATLPQSVQDQIATAAATGDVVEIPVADVLTVAPGTALEQALVEHARTDPFSMSQAEATKAGEQAQAFLQQEAERVIAEAQNRDALQASHDVVKQTIVDELTAAGRYRPAVNEGMATWAAAFYTAYGSRLALTPEEMFSRYRLRILGKASSDGQTVMGQPGTTNFDAWFGDSKVRDAEGKPLVVYHGSPDMRFMKDDAVFKSQKDRIGMGQAQGAHWFTPSMSTARSYADPHRAFDYQNAEEGVISAYIKLVNPLVIDGGGQNWRDAQRVGKTGDVIAEARAAGHDGIIIRSVKDDYINGKKTKPTDTYVVFDSTQIKSATGNSGAFDPANPSILAQITPEQARETNVPVEMPADPLFAEAVANTPGAQVTADGLMLDLVRFQKEDQEGAQAIRTGVFYLPVGSPNAKHYRVTPTTKSPNAYGGTEKMAGPTLIRRPLFVKGGTGGKAPEAAYDAIKGKGAMKALDKAVMDVVTSRGFMNRIDAESFRMKVEQFLGDNGGERGLAWEIIENSKQGNTLRYALQEHVIAHAARAAGYDAVVGYTKGKAGAGISEVFDVREQTYPARGMDSQVHDAFYNQQERANPKLTAWFGTDSTMVNPDGTPRVLYHGTTKQGAKGIEAGNFKRSTYGAMGPAVYLGDDAEASAGYFDGAMLQVYARGKYLNNQQWTQYVNANGWDGAEVAAKADGWSGVYDEQFENAVAVWNPADIKAVNAKEFADDGRLLSQGPRGTFNPKTLELVLNPNANLSTFFHETGHFFLEVMADIASQPNAPAQIVEDMATFLKWAGVADLATWNALDLDGKRPAHERWAESIEQYVMEGKAPSVELAPLMRRFATWLKSVYGSIKQFLAARGQAAPGGDALNQADDSAFKRWFGDSKVVDENGQPLVVYHGTGKQFDAFDIGRESKNFGTFGEFTVSRLGAFFAVDKAFANEFKPKAGNLVQAFLSLQNPVDLVDGYPNDVWTKLGPLLRENNLLSMPPDGMWELFDEGFPGGAEFVQALKDAGYDGAKIGERDNAGNLREVFIAFDSTQIKSATGNDGTFDANDPSILSQDPAAQPGPPMALNDDIRRVMDRMLATDEQIAQANEVAGLVPDEAADAAAAERLNKRSMADLKWAVRARDQVIGKLRKQAAAIEKDIRQQITVEVDQTPEMRAKRALDALTVTPEYAATLAEHKAARKAAEAATRGEVKAALLASNPDAKGLVKGQLLMKNKRDIDNKVESAMIKWDQANPTPKRPVNATDTDVATIADSFGFESVDGMLQAVDAFGSRADAIEGLTERRMLEEHGDLIDERAITEAANEAVHNEARARSLASELRTQREMLNPRAETGETTAKGAKITVNALVEAAKQFAANVVARTTLRDLTARAWQHTAAERRAAKRWQEATAGGKTAEAVKAKQDQMLNHAAAKAAIDAKAEAGKILDFFKRVTQGNDETVVEKGRDADIVNAARAVLGAYGVQTSTTKRADEYLAAVQKNDPETYNVIFPMIEGATRNAQPLDALTFEELQGLNEEIQALWFLAKRSRQMEVGGDLMDVQDVADEVYDRLEEIGIPDTLPGETGALTEREIQARRWLQQVPALLRRVEQWAEAKDGKFGGPFLRYIFQPVKDAADRYRTAKIEYRKKFGDLVDAIAPMMPAGLIQAPEIGYVFGRGHNGIGMAELLHAIAHTGNESNKRKLLLGRGWATDNGDGTIDTAKWDAFIQRLVSERKLLPPHFDFVQGVWDLMEQTKPLAQKTHREVFGRYFAEVTADPFVDPFGVQRAGGYIPAQADPLLVTDADLRELLETENADMAQAFPATARGFTKSRVEYNRPLKLDLRTLPQHIDKVLLFSHMEPAVRGVARLLRQPKVAQPLARVDPAAIGGMLKPWLNRSARQTVETPVSADAGLNRVLSTVRARVGMALMFANVSNALQQITGFSSAALKVKPGLMTRAAAQFIANPKRFKDAVWALSPYMADRASNEVAVMSDTMEKILIKPSVYARAEMWTREHAYFLQTAFDNVMSPIIWTGAYNQGVAEGVDERMAVRYADGVIRQTQGSTLPEDVSRIESGPAYARVFTQFIGYFNMLANTNGTALQQIAQEQGLKKGAGKAFGVVMLGLLTPIWVAEAIAIGMRGGPEDDEDDGYLDDWLAAVFGFGTIRGILGGIPFVGAAAQSAVNRFNDQPADDKFSLSPTVSVLESAVAAPASVYGAIIDDKNAQKAVRDLSALITVATGLPAMTVARPVGYLAGVAQGRIEPTGAVDAARGVVTGTASPDSKQR